VSAGGEPVSTDVTRTKMAVVNSGNIEADFGIEISNIAPLNEHGWDATLRFTDSDEEVEELTIGMQASVDLYVEYTSIRSDPDPKVEATITVWSLVDPGQAALATVPILLPDVSIGPGGLDVVRDDISYEYDASNMYVNIGLVLAIGSLVSMFMILRRKKGLGGKWGSRRRGEKQ
jgi:hypothetical protein